MARGRRWLAGGKAALAWPGDFPARLDPLVLVLVWAGACLPWLRGACFTAGDSVGAFFAQSSFVVSSIRRGEAPWWDPYMYGGQPVLGDPQSLIFTPHTIVGLLAGRGLNLVVFDITTLLCVLCGGLALHHYAGSYTGVRLNKLLGAMVFMLGGVASSRLQHVPEVISYSLLPLQLLALRAACARPRAASAVWLCAACLGGLLNPNQVVFLSAFALLPFFLWHLAGSPQPIRASIVCGAAALAALLIASPVLLSMREYLAVSNRPVLTLGASAGFSFPLFNLPSLALPGLYGMLRPRHGFWSPTDADQDYLYIGLVPACLVAWSFIRAPRLRMPALLALLLAIFWFLFTLGANAPLYPLLFKHLPGLSGFRRPADGAFLMNFSIAILIATIGPTNLWPWRLAGMRGAFEARPWRRLPSGTSVLTLALMALLVAVCWAAMVALHHYALRLGHRADLSVVVREACLRLMILVAALAATAWCGHLLKRRLVPVLLVALTAVDLCSAGRFNYVHTMPYRFSAVAQIYRHSKPNPDSRPLIATIRFLQSHGQVDDPNGSRAEILGGTLAATMPLAERIQVTQGYNPIVLRAYADVIGAQDLQIEPKIFPLESPGYDSDAYRRIGLRYVLLDRFTMNTRSGAPGVASRLLQIRAMLQAAGPSQAKPLGAVGYYEVWALANATPRATLLAPSGACTIPVYQNTRVVIRCQAAQATTLVVGDNFAPGWSACVNGIWAPVNPYEGFVRSINVPAGNDMVTLNYQPVPFLRRQAC